MVRVSGSRTLAPGRRSWRPGSDLGVPRVASSGRVLEWHRGIPRQHQSGLVGEEDL